MTSTDAIDRKRAIRSANRGVLMKYIREAAELLSGEKDQGKVDRLTTLDKLLNEKSASVNKLDTEILEECDVGDIEQDIEESEEIMSRVYDIRKKIEQSFAKERQTQVLISEASKSPPKKNTTHVEIPLNTESSVTETTESVNEHSNQEPQSTQSRQEASPSRFVAKTKLPKLSLPKFKGEITKFRTFWDSFQSVVDSNPDLSPIDKFNHLYSLLEGPGLQVIQGLTITEDHYKSAVKILNQRVGKSQQVILAHVDELLKLPACSGDKASNLRLIYDKVSVNVRGLEAIGVKAEQYGSLLIPVIMSKLPADVRIHIARNTSNDVWEIQELLDIIRKEVEAREVCENVKTRNDNPNKKFNATYHRGLSSASALFTKELGSGNQVSIRCAFCQKPNFSASCENVRDINKRKEILKREGRCFVWLQKGHVMRQYDNTKKCRKCQGNHHQSICKGQDHPHEIPKKPETPRSSEQSPAHDEPTLATSTVNQHSTSTTRGKKVLLQTATTFVFSCDDNELAPVRILFDNGSQCSYITDHLKERLGLEAVRTEPSTLTHLEMNESPSNAAKKYV